MSKEVGIKSEMQASDVQPLFTRSLLIFAEEKHKIIYSDIFNTCHSEIMGKDTGHTKEECSRPWTYVNDDFKF